MPYHGKMKDTERSETQVHPRSHPVFVDGSLPPSPSPPCPRCR
ncbi:unnamed protein product, partial [Ascophyllum nodosum]